MRNIRSNSPPPPIRTTEESGAFAPRECYDSDKNGDHDAAGFLTNDGNDGGSRTDTTLPTASSTMRQGRFGDGAIASPPRVRFQQAQQRAAMAAPRVGSPDFMFEECEGIRLDDPHESPSSSNDHSGGIPTETQLTLLCLDYLRSLRRAYSNPQDLLHGEGLHADYITLAIWSLSRAFAAPDKLKFHMPKLSTVVDEDHKSNKDVRMIGGGGLAGVDDECVGNDSFYRLTKKITNNNGSSSLPKNSCIPTPPTELFALTDTIKMPSMTDMTNEVLLCYNNKNDYEDECLMYEQNDMHTSNSHRFYLFNGMASGDDSMGMGELVSGLSPKMSPKIIDGGPLTLCDLATVALSTLNAKSRIEAEKVVVKDPLFESFIKAADEKGFFNEKKLEKKGREEDDNRMSLLLSTEEEARRQRVLYESKYRKVVAKFRSKLAVREEELMLNGGEFRGGGGVWSPRSAQRALINVHSVSDRLELRRDRTIEQVRRYRRVDDDAPFTPHLLSSGHAASQFIPQHSKSDDGIKTNVMAEPSADIAALDKTIQDLRGDISVASVAKMQSVIDALKARLVAQQRRPVPPIDPPSPETTRHSSEAETLRGLMAPPLSPDKAATTVPPSQVEVAPFYQEAERLNTQGNELMQKKQFSQALVLYTAALKKCPSGPNTHVYYSNRSAAHLSLGDAEFSIQDSKLALTIRPDYVKARARLGLAHYALGRYEEAVESYEAALDLEPDNDWVKKQYEKARKMLVAMQEEEKNEVASNDEEEENDDWPSPFASFDEGTKRHVSEDEVRQADEYKDSGNAYMKNKKYEEALHEYNLAIEISADGPNSHIYYSNRAAAHCYLGQYAEAAYDCRKSIELNDSYEKAYSRYGLSLFFLGEYELSIDAYRKSLDLAPDNKASLSYLAKAKTRLAEKQENEMQERISKKLNLANDAFGEENNDRYGKGSDVANTESNQSRDDEGERVNACRSGNPSQNKSIIAAFDPFDTV